MASGATRVLIAGGGVAGLEALLALRELAEDRVAIQVLNPKSVFAYRPLAVAEPFGLGESHSFDLDEIAAEQKAELLIDGLEAVEPAEHRVITRRGAALSYDILIVAAGAKAGIALPGSVTIKGPSYTGRFRSILRELEDRRIRQVTFAVPPGATWPLPLYELALMTGARVAELGLRKVELRLVTPESEPLEIFGPGASASVRALLEERGVELHTNHYPAAVEEGRLTVVPPEAAAVPAQRVVSMPRLSGPRIQGLPSDGEGFIPVDAHCLVEGSADIYAAGDATTFPVKQGGIAAQQADAAAEAIAARVGVPLTPAPFRPILRGLLLTGERPRFLRSGSGDEQGLPWQVSEHALWWPPSKVAGRYLAPYLALREEDAAVEVPGAKQIEVDLAERTPQGNLRHAVIVPSHNGTTTAVQTRSHPH